MKTKNQNETTIIKLDNGFELVAVPIRNLKKGEWFTRKPIAEPKESQVWIKGEWDISDKKFYATSWADMNKEIYLKSSTIVYTNFNF